jgi:type II secretory pathway pseudopilin PulG
MFVLGVLAFVALVAGQTFLGVTRTTTQLTQHQTSQIRVDQAIRRLRQDVWNATQITLPDPQHLHIQLGDKSVTWTTAQSLKRESGSDLQHWDDLQTTLHFEQHGPTISLAQDPTQSEAGGRVTLLNANSLLKGPAQ